MKKPDKKINKKPEENGKKISKALIIAENFKNPHNLCYLPVFLECALEKSIQTIERSHLKEIYIYSHSKEPLTSFINSRKRENKNIKILINEKGISLGDAMRFVHELEIFEENFVLMFGDLVTDLSVNSLLEEFEAKHEKNSSTLMLKVFHEKEKRVPKRYQEEEVLVYDPIRMLMKGYEALKINSKKNYITVAETPKFAFKRIFGDEKNQENFNLRFDLAESGVAVCRPDVVNYYHEHFDFQHEKEHFLKDLLTSEINDFSVGIYVIDSSVFIKRVNNPFECFRTSQLLVKNCLKHFYCNKNEFCFTRYNKIVAVSAKLHMRSKVGNTTFLGANTSVGEDTCIENSIVLPNCVIGKNVRISGCFLNEGTLVNDGSCLENIFVMDQKRKNLLESKVANQKIWEDIIEKLDFPDASGSEDEASLLSESEDEAMDKDSIFRREIGEIFSRKVLEESQMENVLKELINARLAGNIYPLEAAVMVFEGILENVKFEGASDKEVLTQFSMWRLVLEKFVRGDENIMESLLESSFRFSGSREMVKLNLIWQILERLEIFTGDKILEWFEKLEEGEPKEKISTVGMMKFIEWLSPEDEEDNDENEGN